MRLRARRLAKALELVCSKYDCVMVSKEDPALIASKITSYENLKRLQAGLDVCAGRFVSGMRG